MSARGKRFYAFSIPPFKHIIAVSQSIGAQQGIGNFSKKGWTIKPSWILSIPPGRATIFWKNTCLHNITPRMVALGFFDHPRLSTFLHPTQSHSVRQPCHAAPWLVRWVYDGKDREDTLVSSALASAMRNSTPSRISTQLFLDTEWHPKFVTCTINLKRKSCPGFHKQIIRQFSPIIQTLCNLWSALALRAASPSMAGMGMHFLCNFCILAPTEQCEVRKSCKAPRLHAFYVNYLSLLQHSTVLEPVIVTSLITKTLMSTHRNCKQLLVWGMSPLGTEKKQKKQSKIRFKSAYLWLHNQ